MHCFTASTCSYFEDPPAPQPPTQHIVSSELNRLSIVNVDLFIFKVSTWHKRVLTSKFSLNLTDLICFHTQLTNFPI